MTITKTVLTQMVMKNFKIKRIEAAMLVEDFFEIIIKSLESGEIVKVPGFGNFNLRTKNPRLGRNPRTKEPHEISARRVVSFRSSNSFKSVVQKRDRK